MKLPESFIFHDNVVDGLKGLGNGFKISKAQVVEFINTHKDYLEKEKLIRDSKINHLEVLNRKNIFLLQKKLKLKLMVIMIIKK